MITDTSQHLKQSKTSTNKAWLYRTIWRWHFYAGIFCIPFIISLAITGSIYLFKPQIDTWVNAPYANLKPAATDTRTSVNQQIKAAITSLPSSSFVNYQLPLTETEAVVVTVNHNGERTLVYVNPFNLDIVKTIAFDDQFIRQVRTFHGELLARNFGSVLIEIAGCWAIVLIVTGVYLWWPRTASGLAGVIYPRLTQGSKVFWRDIHAVIGIWIASFALFLLVSGLPWALVWGSAFKEVRQMLATDMQPVMASEHAEHSQHQAMNITVQPDWTLSRQEEQSLLTNLSATSTVNLSEQVVEQAIALQLAPPVFLSIEKNDTSLWHASSDHQNRPLRADAWIKSETGEIVRQQNFADKNAIDRVVGIGVAAHEGQLFGWFNQLLGLMTALGLVAMSASGFVMWRKRKPQGALGAPKKLQSHTTTQTGTGKGIVIIVFGLAAVLPLLAMSLVIILILEFFLLKRIVAVREWLGLSAT